MKKVPDENCANHPQFAVTGALVPADLAVAAGMGFPRRALQPARRRIAGRAALARERQLAARARAGLCLPCRFARGDMALAAIAREMLAALGLLKPPVLAHCASGQRLRPAAWAVAAARCHSVDRVLSALTSAGFYFAPLRAELKPGRARQPRLAAPGHARSGLSVGWGRRVPSAGAGC